MNKELGPNGPDATMEWWLRDVIKDEAWNNLLIALLRTLTTDEQISEIKRLKDLNVQKQVFEYKQSLALDPPPTVP